MQKKEFLNCVKKFKSIINLSNEFLIKKNQPSNQPRYSVRVPHVATLSILIMLLLLPSLGLRQAPVEQCPNISLGGQQPQ